MEQLMELKTSKIGLDSFNQETSGITKLSLWDHSHISAITERIVSSNALAQNAKHTLQTILSNGNLPDSSHLELISTLALRQILFQKLNKIFLIVSRIVSLQPNSLAINTHMI